jgi:hypothetical protein
MLRTLLRRTPIIGPRIAKYDDIRSALTWPPGHYYSPIPDFAELETRKAEVWPTNPPRVIEGMDLNESGQLALVGQLAELNPAQPPFPDKPSAESRFYYENGFFGHSDATVLHLMLRHLKPRRLIEVGSGFSSCVTLETNEKHLDGALRCTFIEPDPVRLKRQLKLTDNVDLIASRVQEVNRAIFSELNAGDVLFIDSSHVAKTGSDVNLLFLDIMPRLKPGVFVHVHDILYPFEYTADYVRHAWNEAYILRAFLTHNAAWRITFFSSFLEAFFGERLSRDLPILMRGPGPVRGTSIWLEKVA